MSNGHRYTKEQDEFIVSNYTNVSECVKKFNETFGTQISYSALKSHANRALHLSTGFRPWSEEMDGAIENILWHYPYKEATEIFNKQFGTKFTKRQIETHCTKVGISRKRKKYLKQVDQVIKQNISKSYEEIMKILNKEMGTDYKNATTICRRANNLGLNRPHRVWKKTDQRFIDGKKVSFSEYVRFIGNRWHRLDKSLRPIAIQIVKLQSKLSEN